MNLFPFLPEKCELYARVEVEKYVTENTNFDLLRMLKCEMAAKIADTILNSDKITVEEKDDGVTLALSARCYVFTREELEKFVKDIQDNSFFSR